MQTSLFRILIILIATAGYFNELNAQTINILQKRKTVLGAEEEPAQISLPAGASAGVNTGASSADAGTLVGVQVSKRDDFFLNVSFRYAGAKKIDGSQKNFGGFMLNPSTQGSSVAVSGNKLWPAGGNGWTFGTAGRFGATFTNWEAVVNQTSEAYDGFVLYFNPSVILSTKTFPVGENDYQFSIELGPSIRALGGDLSQATSFLADANVLGVDKKSMFGIETTVSVRLNSIQPFLRLSQFNAGGNTIKGFSGLQGYIGINVLSSFFNADLP